MEKFYSTKEAADRLGLSTNHIAKLIRYGEIEASKTMLLNGNGACIKYYMIPESEITRYEKRRFEKQQKDFASVRARRIADQLDYLEEQLYQDVLLLEYLRNKYGF